MDTTLAQPDARPAGKGWGGYIGWGVAFVVVVVAWAGAFALRGGGAPAHLDGWQPGLDAGMAVAEETDRPMLVMFTADWCGPCQVLKREVIHTPEVEAAIDAGFVPVMIDLSDQSADNPNMPAAQRYGVRGIPMLILTDAQGNPLPGTIAYPNTTDPRTPQGFIDWLGSAERAQAARP